MFVVLSLNMNNNALVLVFISAVNAGQTELTKVWANWSNVTNRDLTFTFPDINPYGCWCYRTLATLLEGLTHFKILTKSKLYAF